MHGSPKGPGKLLVSWIRLPQLLPCRIDSRILSVLFCIIFIHSFIHSGHFYSASSSPLLFRSATNTARILC